MAVAVVAVGSPVITRVFAHDVLLTVLLALSMPGMAYAYLQRGLVAGARRYNRYALSFAVEALTTLLFGAVLLGLRARHALVGTGVRARPDRVGGDAVGGEQAPADRRVHCGHHLAGDRGHRCQRPGVVGGGAGVGRRRVEPGAGDPDLAAAPEIAAGFTSMALILRIPILFFPSAQALLLPVLTASGGAVRAHMQAAWPKLIAAGIGVWCCGPWWPSVRCRWWCGWSSGRARFPRRRWR